jgi:hypothetical protein
MKMDELNLLFRPTIEALIEDCHIDADNDDGLLFAQGVESEPVCIQKDETFEIPEGREAVPDDCECFLAGEKDDFVFFAKRNGFWIDPEGIRVLLTGRYQYMGEGIVQRSIDDDECLDSLALGIRQTKTPEELGGMSQEEVEEWERDVLLADYKPGKVFKIRCHNEGILAGPPCFLEHDEIEQPLNTGAALPAGEYRYAGNGVIQRVGWLEVPVDCAPPDLAKVKGDFIRILTSAFPEYEFKFERDDFYCKLEAKWVNIFEYTHSLPDERADSGWMLDSLGSADDALNKKFLGYQVMRDMVHCSPISS